MRKSRPVGGKVEIYLTVREGKTTEEHSQIQRPHAKGAGSVMADLFLTLQQPSSPMKGRV